MPYKIHLLTHPKFLGDKNQALGIASKLQKKYGADKVEIKEWNDSDDKDVFQINKLIESDTVSQHIVITIGDHGLLVLQKIKKTSNVFSVWAGHQVFPELKNSADCIDIVALPAHVINEPVKTLLSRTRLIETIGVAHNVTDAELETCYQEWQKESKRAIPASEHCVGVILGGDAPEADGKTMRYFTPSEAKAMAHFLVTQVKKDTLLLITNSPRTGKYHPENKTELKVHCHDSPVDATSQALLDELDSLGVEYRFFNFEAGKTSAYKPILRALQGSKTSIAVVTGDSTSMITEMADSLCGKPLYVVNVNSMNPAHIAHVHSVDQAGIAGIIHLGEPTRVPEIKRDRVIDRSSAAENIAKSIFDATCPSYIRYKSIFSVPVMPVTPRELLSKDNLDPSLTIHAEPQTERRI